MPTMHWLQSRFRLNWGLIRLKFKGHWTVSNQSSGELNSNILIAINDNYADGRDVSWLWDADFEQLKNADKLVITSGIRAYDMAVRLKYAGIPQERITVEPNLEKAIQLAASTEETDKITILPSYTALLKINKLKLRK